MKIAFVSSPAPEARRAAERLRRRCGDIPPEDAEALVVLGGDGTMLRALHESLKKGGPAIYGMKLGAVGFLMNAWSEDGLPERIAAARRTTLHPLRMEARGDGAELSALAVNEVSLLRQSPQTARIRISVDGKMRLEELMSDGVLVATPAGSTAYNRSVHGPVLPLDAPLLALTPISAFRPRQWRGALLPSAARVALDILDHERRPVSAIADHQEVRNVIRVEVREDKSARLDLLFDKDHGLEERILREQFAP